MKKMMAVALVAALALACAPAHAAKHWDDMSWWGNTGATPAPVADSKGRSGYWWWPTEAASNVDDTELWGNRGIVYHTWEQPAAPEAVATPAETPPAAATRTVPVLNNILFDFDKSVLKPEGQAIAGEAIAVMKEFPGDTVVIEGHTCNIGTDEYNMGLGGRRADSVQSYLTSNGIDAARVSAKSYGETTPAVPNDNSANRALNRRAVFQFTLGN